MLKLMDKILFTIYFMLEFLGFYFTLEFLGYVVKSQLESNTIQSLYNAMFGIHLNGPCYKQTMFI